MNRVLSLTLLLALFTNPLWGADKKEQHPVLKELSAGLSEIAKDLGEGTELQTDQANSVRLSFRPRTFMVHGGSKTGRFAKKAHEEKGPDVDGLMVEVRVGEGRYLGAAATPQTLRRPYWKTFINQYPISQGREHLFLSLSTGAQPNREVVSKVYKFLDSLVDDDPKAGQHIRLR